MKNSKEHGTKLDKLLKALKGGPKIKPPVFDDPVEAIVFGTICEHFCEKNAKKIFKQIKTQFVDFNDLRISRTEEIMEILEDDSPAAQQCAENITSLLSSILDKYDTLCLKQPLAELGKRQGKKELEELPGASQFAVSFCFLTAMGGHAIPLTAKTLEFLRREGIVEAEAGLPEIDGFMERHITAAHAYETYELLRQAAESPAKKPRPAASDKKEPKKTAAKRAKKKSK